MAAVFGIRPGDHGPTVGPDELGAAGPAWVITAAGHTVRGWAWFVVRRRGGQIIRLTLHGNAVSEETAREVIALRVARTPRRPADLETKD